MVVDYSVVQSESVNQSENQFMKWLDYKKYGYVYLNQSPSTFAEAFRNQTKRPDFQVKIPAIGNIAVDVKDFTHSYYGENWIFDENNEILKAKSYETISGLPYWYAFSCDKISYKTWYWISLDGILNNISRKKSSKSSDFFYPINIQEDCRVLGWNDNFARLLD